MRLAPPLTLPIVCLITDRRLVPTGSLPDAVAAAVAGGVTMVQLREKDLPTRGLLDLATQLREAIQGRALLLINGRADIAVAVGADGVHLPADGLPTDAARRILPGTALVGRSVHSPSEAAGAARDGADYVELGTVFPSRSHPGGPTIGLDGVRAAAGGAAPLLAVGGIDAQSAGDVVQAGAAGVAVISAILGAPDPRRAAEGLTTAVTATWEHRVGARRPVVRSVPEGRA